MKVLKKTALIVIAIMVVYGVFVADAIAVQGLQGLL